MTPRCVSPFVVVPGLELPHDVIQMPLRDDHKRIQALVLQRLNCPLDMGLEVR